jgi:hypothetical protein
VTPAAIRAGIISGPAFNHSDFCWGTRLLPGKCCRFKTAQHFQRTWHLPRPWHLLRRDLPLCSLFLLCFLRPNFVLQGVSDAFSLVFGGDRDLVVSFDGGNAFRPWRHNPSWKTKGGWWHVDQNSLKGEQRRGRVCVQANHTCPSLSTRTLLTI